MTEQELIAIAKAPAVAYSNKDWEAMRASAATGFFYDEIATQRKTQGVDEAIELWRGWAAAFPDSKATFENTWAGSGGVVLELTWRGTNTGPLRLPSGEIPATGKGIEIRACQIIEIEEGKVKSMRHYFDMMTLMQQLGLNA